MILILIFGLVEPILAHCISVGSGAFLILRSLSSNIKFFNSSFAFYLKNLGYRNE